jgi:Leucine-rich repeat (LRR) protein
MRRDLQMKKRNTLKTLVLGFMLFAALGAGIANPTRVYADDEGIEINKTNFPELTKLDCSENSITKLDLSKNTKLTSLKCAYNKLSTLDVSNNTALTVLKCRDNKLTKLNVSKNKKLKYLLYDKSTVTLTK